MVLFVQYYWQAPIQGPGWGSIRVILTLLFHVLPKAPRQQPIANPSGRQIATIDLDHQNQLRINYQPERVRT
jgi:hypothetical protein